MATRTTTDESPIDGSAEKAYEVVPLQELWGILSLGFFVLSLTTRYTVRFLPPTLPGWGELPPDPILAILAVPLVSILGIGSALLAGRHRTATGRIGFFLNVTVFGLIVALLGLVTVWFVVR